MPGPMPTPIGRRWTRRSARTKRLEPWPLSSRTRISPSRLWRRSPTSLFGTRTSFPTTRFGRTVLTLNRWEFVRLHAAHPEHSGIIVCTLDPDPDGQATRIDQVLGGGDAAGQLRRVNRPPR